ncbi:MAG: tetratricopeptide repeat protein [Pseudomonadota bacterium]
MHRAMAFAIMIATAPTLAAAGQRDLENCANPALSASETVNFCQKALRDRSLEPTTRAQILVNVGVALAEMGRHSDAVNNYALARDTNPQLLPAYTNRARSNEALGRPDEALADYAGAIAADPGWVDAWAGRGALLLRHDRADQAVGDLTQALELDGSDIAVRFNRGVAYLRIGDPARAKSDFDRIITDKPGDAGAYLNRGRARAQLDDAGAQADFDRALELSPEWGWGHFIRGRYHDGQKREEAANRDYLRAFELGYSEPWLLERVRRISGS